jgi:hypothetical protein
MICASVALWACSDDDVVSDPTGGQQTENDGYNTYVTISLSMPESTDTRADGDATDPNTTLDTNEGNTVIEATDLEKKVNKIYVYAFQAPSSSSSAANDAWELAESVSISTVKDAADYVEMGASNTTSTAYCYGTAVFKRLIKGTDYHIYVSVNAEALNEDGQPWAEGSTVEEFLAKSRFDITPTGHINTGTDSNTGSMYYTSDRIVTSFQMKEPEATATSFSPTAMKTSFTNGFVMASRRFNNLTGTTANNIEHDYAELHIYTSNSESNPATANVAVERVMARLDLGVAPTTEFEGKLQNPANTAEDVYATVTLDKYFPVNLSKQSYLFRHKATGSASALETSTTYTYDQLADLDASDWKDKVWTSAEYVIDPYTTQKTSADYSQVTDRTVYGNMFYNALHTVYTKATSKAVSEETTTTTEPASKIDAFATIKTLTSDNNTLETIGYCLENTTLADYQQKDYSTGVIISGTFTVSDDHVYAAYDGGVQNIKALKALQKTAGAFSDTEGSTTNYNTIAATALSTYGTAKTNLKTAQGNYDTALKAYNEAQAALATEQDKYDATIAVGSTYTQAEKDAAKAALDKAQTAATTADHNLNGYTPSEGSTESAIQGATAALTAAQTAYDDALTAYRAAQKDSATYANSSNIATALQYKDLYFYNYNFYTSLDALSKVMTLPDDLITKTEDGKTVYDMDAKPANGKSNLQILSEYGVTFYKQELAATTDKLATYRTYYLYVLKHYNYASGTTDTDISVMSPMKYAVVRNNVYQMKIKGVAALGSSSWDPTDPDPLDGYYPGPNPDEEREIYLKMELDILKWVVRTQGENGGITLK